MSYKVLARKWRPDHFDEVVGQGHVATTLINSIEQDRVAHSYLFCGARGVGKTSTARILAKAMNCEEGPRARPCYKCSSCTEISKGQSVDVFEIDGASNRGINEIRELREGVRYAPSRDAKKIYIIDEVHMLTTEAFNALLKTLEEPPPHAIFIFATTEPQKIPVTILSRCQRFDFKRISQHDIVAHLEKLCELEEIEVERAALQVIARQANGGMRDALSLLDQIISFSGNQITEREITEILGVANRKHLFELSEAVLARDAEQALLVLDEVNRYGYDLQQFASELVTHFRDLMVTAVVKAPEKVTQLTESELTTARAQVKDRSSELLHRYFSVMVDGAQQMSRSSYPKLIFEMMLVRLSELEPMMNLDLLVDRLALLESSLDGDGGPVHWPEPVAQEKSSVTQVENSGSENGPPGKVEARAAEEVRATAQFEVEKPEPTPDKAEPASKPVPTPEPEVVAEPVKSESKQSARDDMPPIDAYDEGGTAVATAPKKAVSEPVSEKIAEKKTEEAVEESVEEKPVSEEPVKPAPLRPSENGEAELPDVDTLKTAQERWRAVVAYLRQENAPVGLTNEHAYVERFEDGAVVLSFEEAFADLAGEEDRRQVLAGAVKKLFGQDWSVTLEVRTGDDSSQKNLAQEREEDILRRRAELERQMRENPAVQAAKELFEAGEPKVSVKLFDE